MCRTVLISVFCMLSFVSRSQPYGNEWINFTQKYYKFKIYKDGIYKIDYNLLSAAGLASVDWRNFQIFGRGKEIHLFISDNGNNSPEPGEFMEFYAQKNDGWLDSSLYAGAGWQPNTNYSLFNDTATCYLTWNSSTSNLRMSVETDTDFTGKVPTNYCIKESRVDYTSVYYGGRYYNIGIYDPQYTIAEGFLGTEFSTSSTVTYDVGTANISTASGAPQANIELVIAGTNTKSSNIKVQFAGITIDTSYSSFGMVKIKATVPVAWLGNPNTNFTVSPNGSSAGSSALSYISISYPHNYNFEGAYEYKFSVPDAVAPQTKTLFDVSNFNNMGTTVYLYDLTNNKKIAVMQSNQNALVPNTGAYKTCYLTSGASIGLITGLEPVNGTGFFTDYNSVKNFNYLIITHKSLLNQAATYSSYRSSPAGGGYYPLVTDVDELYDQFAYGIKKHPLSIRWFSDFALDKWDTIPKYLFIIGKSVINAENRTAPGSTSRGNTTYYANNLVPSMGHKPSDNLLTAGLNGTLYQPAIATGRLAAKTPQEVDDYLYKVIEFDQNQADNNYSIENKAWMKNILHFGGGTNLSEQRQFADYLEEYRQIIESPYFGGSVSTFLKNTSDPIQLTVSERVHQLIDNGVSLLTFFGHASGSGFDQNIDAPESYNNKGKYPVLLANSCQSGDIHGAGSASIAEKFILIPDKGMIGFIASVSLGEISPLYRYSKTFYQNISKDNYGDPLGNIIQQTVADVQASTPQDKITLLEMTLHGDPAIRINHHDLPDLTLRSSDVYFNPSDVSTSIDSFNINIIISNIGMATDSAFTVELKRIFQNNSAKEYQVSVPGVRFIDTLTLTLPVDLINGVGLNIFEITLDRFGQIEEENENNNFASVQLFIKSGDIIPVYPYNYAIVPSKSVVLKASTGDAFAGIKNYLVELDTTDDFNSPMKLSQSVTMSGGVLSWAPDSTKFSDSVVYFWRVAASDSLKWGKSSFQYIKGKTGWGQSHFFQFESDFYNFINYDRNARKFDFIPVSKNLFCRNIGSSGNLSSSQVLATEYLINSSNMANGSCDMNHSIHIAVIDSTTLSPWKSDFANSGQYNYPYCPGTNNATKYFIFHTLNSAHRINMANMIDSIPDNHYILAYNFGGGHFNLWENQLLQTFGKLGADTATLRTISDNRPYILFVKKGNLSTLKQALGTQANDTVELQAVIENKWPFGDITSTTIGPAKSWGSLHWTVGELGASDKVGLNVSELDSTKSAQPIAAMMNLPPDSSDIYNLPAIVDAKSYPYLKLNVFKEDNILQTSSQIRKWQVMYEPAGEMAINPLLFYYFYSDTIKEGETLQFSTVAQNISDYSIDSLLISYWILDMNREVKNLTFERKKPVSPGDTVLISIKLSTKGLSGLNSLWVQINPNNDQPEQDPYSNNFAEKFFYVKRDETNPLLDVTFDGTHILDGDIVSAKPAILIQLRDENPYLLLDSNNLLQVWIKYPGETDFALVAYDSKVLSFIPASTSANKARVEYTPDLSLQNGIYEMKVQARDKSNNESGSFDYDISFEVDNKPSVTQVLNWPNPFSTSTRFVFTLTGSQIPQDFKIQIMTVTGKVVKEIFADELGMIRIGRNITEYAWNGTDEFGDRLANGVYLYKVFVKLNGKDIEMRETDADRYFHKGYGKMYLMR